MTPASRRPPSRSPSGFTLIELLVVFALVLLLATLAISPLHRAVKALRLRQAASELVGSLRLARSFAVRYSANVAVRFNAEPKGGVSFSLYRDGNGNGVRNAEIRAGTDPKIDGPRHLGGPGFGLRFGFPPGIRPTDPGDPSHRLDRLDDPIRFNESDLASFDPLGGATPGSLYLTDGYDGLAAIRVLNRSGRVRVLTYKASTGRWK
jgi:prepilin-type N-terminal cleavage/methylation domain-containing protein